MVEDAPSGVRLAELVAALSMATDLGLGLPQEHVLRQTVIASRLAGAAGLSTAQQASTYYCSLLAWVGCVSDSHELAKWFGDDLTVKASSARVDKAGLPFAMFMLSHVGDGSSPVRRLMAVARFLTGGSKEAAQSMATHCEATGLLADQIGLSGMHELLVQAFERWDGRGVPSGVSGDKIDPVVRVVQIADDSEVLLRVGGVDAAVEMLRDRRGTEFDPDLVDLACDRADDVFADLDGAWDAVIDSIDGPDDVLSEARLTAVLEAFADYADVKSIWWPGHSRGVAALTCAAAEALGLPPADCVKATRAALVHDIGTVGVSTGVWDKTTPLTASDRERVRTHPYLTERVLARPEPLREVGAVASLHHERLDGSGYPRGVGRDSIPITARIVAAADVLQALAEDRPHRTAVAASEREGIMRDEVRAGRLDGDAVNAVLAAAGHRVRRRPALPAGLTQREVEVLELIVRGLPNKQIARELDVTPRTVSSHTEHIYSKIGVSTRGAAALFAMRNGLAGAEP